jgi:hypothetical protein
MNPKTLGLILVSAIASMALFASNAMATTIEKGGAAQTSSVTIEATLNSSSWLLTDTAGFLANTCSASTLKWSTSSPFTGTTVSGPVSTLSSSSCTNGTPTLDAAGTLSIEHVPGTTKGTVRSTGTKTTVPSPFGTLTCTTSNTDIGMLTGVPSSTGVLDIFAVLSCTVIGTAKWSGTYVITTSGIGVVA